MALPDEQKRKAMDPIASPDVKAHVRAFRKHPVVAPAKAPVKSVAVSVAAKREMMDAIKAVETVAQIGAMKLTGGIILYAGRIREADKERGTTPRRAVQRNIYPRDLPGGRFYGR